MDTSIISALGAGSGIDTTSLVKSLVEVEKAPQQARLDTKTETLNAQISAYGTLKSSLAEFQAILEPLSKPDTFNARAVSFPETDVISPNAIAANAQAGTYQIEVHEVAQAQALAVNTAYADKNESVGSSGNLTIRLGSWAYDVGNNPTSFAENESQTALVLEIAADDSIQDIADKINAAESDVQASVLLVDGQYQLMISAPSGANNALEITGDDPSLDIFAFNATNYAGVTETQQAQDSEIKINGLTVFRESNEINDVIEGLTFNINKASPDEKFTFTISEDKDTAEQSVRDFVDAYNTLYDTAKSLTGTSTDAETNISTRGELATDSLAKSVMSRIRQMVGTAVPGVSDFNSLSMVGIRTQLDGKLEINETDFTAAVKDNFDKIGALFSPQTSSSTSDVDVSIGSYASKTVSGVYSGSITTAPAKGSVISDTAFVAFNTSDTPAGDFTFSIDVNGTSSGELTLVGDFTTQDELRSALQALINNDDTLKASGALVDVGVEPGGEITLSSRQFGSSSQVSLTANGTEFATATGLSTASVSTNGHDVAGTINGEAAFGAGEVLLPSIDTDPYGLNLSVKQGATLGDFSFTFSQGFAGELSQLIDSFLSSSGSIKSRETSINNQLDGIVDSQETLDRKMTKYETRLSVQFLAMERIVASFKTTSDSLTGIVDRLPFTASN
ncbi:flagellar filament capping protein FliD [Neptunomonas antarctica]|uniref:Flagellar hook-associated protein 2 n=1 Tax=Neptunomonas antarctica TaxID=619304 RepID=A0A1N7JBY8_9GAMM|nr:flagellar filament capping protein FliD [Neptunomonas antarctica]SIS46838.1 flagellar hook-associated protein 2 [Neptunomonas antarctica]